MKLKLMRIQLGDFRSFANQPIKPVTLFIDDGEKIFSLWFV